MKHFIMIVCGILAMQVIPCAPAAAQGFFNQKKAQKKRLIEQIALLQIYIELLKKGYHIVEDGLHLINDIKHGDFNIHHAYFTSLKEINPAIRGYSKVNEITDLYEQIAQLYDRSTKSAKDAAYGASERETVERVFVNLLTAANETLTELKTLTTAGNFELKDDERLSRIEALWCDMKDKYAFAKTFANSVDVLLLQKKRELRDITTDRNMLELK